MSSIDFAPTQDDAGSASGRADPARHHRAWPVATLAFALILALLVPTTGHAQGAKPQIVVASEMSVIPTAPAPLKVDIVNLQTVAKGSFLYFVNLPSGSSLNTGFRVTPDSWAVPVDALEDLRLLVPNQFEAPREARLQILTPQGTVVARAALMLFSVDAGDLANRPAKRPGGTVTALAPPKPSLARNPSAAAPASAAPISAPTIAPPAPAGPGSRRAATVKLPPIATTPARRLPPVATTPARRLPPIATTPARRLPPIATTPARPQAPVTPATPRQPAAAPQPRQRTAALTPPKPAPPAPKFAEPKAPVMTAKQHARAERLYGRGREALQLGDVATARNFFRRAARIGLSTAAKALGDTYQTTMLRRLGAIGVMANADLAAIWHARARQLAGSEKTAGR